MRVSIQHANEQHFHPVKENSRAEQETLNIGKSRRSAICVRCMYIYIYRKNTKEEEKKMHTYTTRLSIVKTKPVSDVYFLSLLHQQQQPSALCDEDWQRDRRRIMYDDADDDDGCWAMSILNLSALVSEVKTYKRCSKLVNYTAIKNWVHTRTPILIAGEQPGQPYIEKIYCFNAKACDDSRIAAFGFDHWIDSLEILWKWTFSTIEKDISVTLFPYFLVFAFELNVITVYTIYLIQIRMLFVSVRVSYNSRRVIERVTFVFTLALSISLKIYFSRANNSPVFWLFVN